jgi:hypothetical protein
MINNSGRNCAMPHKGFSMMTHGSSMYIMTYCIRDVVSAIYCVAVQILAHCSSERHGLHTQIVRCPRTR